MRKIAIAVTFALVALFSQASAGYNSGWKYVESLCYDFNGGALQQVSVYGQDYVGGPSGFLVTFFGSDLGGCSDIMYILEQLERAESHQLRVHYRNDSRNVFYSHRCGDDITFDVQND